MPSLLHCPTPASTALQLHLSLSTPSSKLHPQTPANYVALPSIPSARVYYHRRHRPSHRLPSGPRPKGHPTIRVNRCSLLLNGKVRGPRCHSVSPLPFKDPLSAIRLAPLLSTSAVEWHHSSPLLPVSPRHANPLTRSKGSRCQSNGTEWHHSWGGGQVGGVL